MAGVVASHGASVASFKSTASYYAFRRRKPFEEIGHNSLAAMVHGQCSLVAIEFITGLVLFNVVEGGPALHFLWDGFRV